MPIAHLNPFRRRATQDRESGQAIVLVALFLSVLIGFTGLAIDGGGMFFLQRDVQNAVDSALLAGAYQLCTNGDVVTGARIAAAQNGFENSMDGVTVTINTPPTSGPAMNDPNYVEVEITAEKPSYFIQIFYPGPLNVTARGVSNCGRTNSSVYAGYAMFATGTQCGNQQFRMSGANMYVGGSAFSNGDMMVNTSNAEITGEAVFAGDAKALANPNNGGYWPHTSIGGQTGYDQVRVDLDSPVPTPLLYDINDFRPGGKWANWAMSQSRTPAGNADLDSLPGPEDDLYYYYNDGNSRYFDGQWAEDFVNNNPWARPQYLPLEGLIVVEGDFKMGSNPRNGQQIKPGPRGLTIVATGKIMVNGPEIGLEKPFVENLLLFSYDGYTPDDPNTPQYEPITRSCPNGHAIQWPSAVANLNGLIYAPGGHVNVPTSSTEVFGQIIAYSIGVNVANFRINYENPYLDPGAPSVTISE